MPHVVFVDGRRIVLGGGHLLYQVDDGVLVARRGSTDAMVISAPSLPGHRRPPIDRQRHGRSVWEACETTAQCAEARSICTLYAHVRRPLWRPLLNDQTSARLYRGGASVHPGRRQLAGPRHEGRGHAAPAVHQPAPGRRTSGTRTATSTSTSCRSWGPMILGWGHPEVVGRLHARSTAGTSYGAPDGARGRAGAPHLRGGAVHRDGAHGQLGHRGDDERRARGPRLHGPREDRQVHRLLPRPLGRASWRPRAAACSRSRCPTARASPRRRRPTRCSSSTTTRMRCASSSSGAARRSPPSSSSPSPATWASCRPQPGFLEAARELCTEAGAVLIFDEVITGLPRGLGRGPGALRRRCRTSPRSARSSAAACRSARSAAAARSWRRWRRSAAPTRPARCRGNPLAMAAGIATLSVLGEPGVYERLEALAAKAGGRAAGGGREGGPAAHAQPGRRHDDALLLRWPGDELRRREGRGHGRLRVLLAPHAGARRATWRRRSSSRR